ncbi:hypothetical protein [Streptomyces sp. NPDC008001]
MAACVENPRDGRTFRLRLRVKGVRRAPGIFEHTLGGNSRAT